jgi:uncharacterized repeat protein (TIGR03803 family)
MRASRFVFPLVTFIRGVNLKSNLRFASLTWFALALLLLPARPAQAQTYAVVHSFAGAPVDGSDPLGGLALGSDGNFYGTTAHGGFHNQGTIFKLTQAGVETVLYSFTGITDGGVPQGGLFRDPQGNLFGTASQGGNASCACGVVFELTTANTLSVIYNFQAGTDGSTPTDRLISINGELYGTTQFGGTGCSSTGGCGTIFKVTENGHETVIYRFTGDSDGFGPQGLIRDPDANLFGVTIAGNDNFGTAFELSASGQFSILHTFTGGSDGASPSGRLLRDTNGNLRGATQGGGDPTCFCGVIFFINPAGDFRVLKTFFSRPNGAEPITGPLDVSAILYGVTGFGGDMNCQGQAGGCGVLFQIGKTGTYSVLHRFTGDGDGQVPTSQLILGSGGNIYGETAGGGTGTNCGSIGCGTIFRYKP